MNKPIITKREGKPRKLTIHKKAIVYDDVQIDVSGRVNIEEGATLYYGVKIITHKHHWSTKTRISEDNTIERVDLTIGRDSFIGLDALILAVESIGEGAIIGARAVVTKNIPPFEVWAGNPARKIGERKDVQEEGETRNNIE
jgi:acetyltransferase-like isoleucine patch superfamily enzyme